MCLTFGHGVLVIDTLLLHGVVANWERCRCCNVSFRVRNSCCYYFSLCVRYTTYNNRSIRVVVDLKCDTFKGGPPHRCFLIQLKVMLLHHRNTCYWSVIECLCPYKLTRITISQCHSVLIVLPLIRTICQCRCSFMEILAVKRCVLTKLTNNIASNRKIICPCRCVTI